MRCYSAEGGVSRVGVDLCLRCRRRAELRSSVRPSPIRMIDEIDALGAKGYLLALGDLEILKHCDVPVLESGTVKKILRLIPERSWRRRRENRLSTRVLRVNVLAAEYRVTNFSAAGVIEWLERALADTSEVSVVTDSERSARLELGHPADAPSVGCHPCPALDVVEGQLVDIVDHGHVAAIVERRSVEALVIKAIERNVSAAGCAV